MLAQRAFVAGKAPIKARPSRSVQALGLKQSERSVLNVQQIGLASLASLTSVLLAASPALAELNQFEENISGEFGRGTAVQYGEVRCCRRMVHVTPAGGARHVNGGACEAGGGRCSSMQSPIIQCR